MHAIGDAGIAQPIGQTYLLDYLAEAHLHVVPWWELGTQHQAELYLNHRILPLRLTDSRR
jgi:hypothetical protein